MADTTEPDTTTNPNASDIDLTPPDIMSVREHNDLLTAALRMQATAGHIMDMSRIRVNGTGLFDNAYRAALDTVTEGLAFLQTGAAHISHEYPAPTFLTTVNHLTREHIIAAEQRPGGVS